MLTLVLCVLILGNDGPTSTGAAPDQTRPALCVARIAPGDTAQRMLASPARFDCQTAQSAFGPGSYWVVTDNLQKDAAIDDDGIVTGDFSFIPGWQTGAALYVEDMQGGLTSQSLDNHRLSRLTRVGSRIDIALESNPVPPARILLRIDNALNSIGLVRDAQFRADRLDRDQELLLTALYSVFTGLGLVLIVYNLVMWLMVRQRFQLTYCLVLASTVIYCWSHAGMLPILLPRSDLSDCFRVSYITLALVATLSLHFMAEFLEPGSLPPWMPRLINWAGRSVMVIALAVALLPYSVVPLVERLYVFAFMPFPALALALIIGSWARGSRYAWMLMVAWSPPMVMALLRILHGAHFIGNSTIVEHSVIIAMTAEAVLSAIAMTLRVTTIIRTRETADLDARLARQRAENDPLTGLINRSALEAMVVRWRSSETLRLMLLDVDQFKQINVRHSHAAGDALLQDIAAVIAARIGERASVARVSGGKFAVVGPVSDLGEATALALLRDIRGHRGAVELGATASIGIAEGRVLNEADWNDLYHRTDQALMEAKASGRNRAVHSADIPMGEDCRTQPAPRLAG